MDRAGPVDAIRALVARRLERGTASAPARAAAAIRAPAAARGIARPLWFPMEVCARDFNVIVGLPNGLAISRASS